jgi:hypothetical protein
MNVKSRIEKTERVWRQRPDGSAVAVEGDVDECVRDSLRATGLQYARIEELVSNCIN